MSYKERMHPQVSKAEIDVFKALSSLGLTGGMVTQKPIVLKITFPDFCWAERKKVIYLDGRQVHNSAKVERRDEEINNLLELQGWDVLRIPYDPPLTGEKLGQVVAQIRDFLGGVDE